MIAQGEMESCYTQRMYDQEQIFGDLQGPQITVAHDIAMLHEMFASTTGEVPNHAELLHLGRVDHLRVRGKNRRVPEIRKKERKAWG